MSELDDFVVVACITILFEIELHLMLGNDDELCDITSSESMG